MSDTGDSVLSPDLLRQLRREIAAARGKEDGQTLVLMKDIPKNGDGPFSKLVSALLPIAVVALVATVWNMSINMAEMRTALASVVAELKEIKEDLKTRTKP